ncbi:MAG TPA: hypothetical protein VFE62_09625 [Gemmataceae bacterium]|nr:hypothetical protein [Gemmataceae bacterium]
MSLTRDQVEHSRHALLAEGFHANHIAVRVHDELLRRIAEEPKPPFVPWQPKMDILA